MTRNIKQAPFAYNPIKDTSLLNDREITKPQQQKNRLKQAAFSKTIIT
jgi:hypothetical protein